jgi:hypothetical protein
MRPRAGANAAQIFREMPELVEDLRSLAEKANQVMPGGRNFH